MNKELRIKPSSITPDSLFRVKPAFTLIELVLTLGIISAMASIGVFYYANAYRTSLLNSAAEELVFLARFSQQESISQKGSNAWGIRFDNTDQNAAFVAVFSGAYAPANVKEYYSFPYQLQMTNPSAGNSLTITFSKLSGLPNATSSVVFGLKGGSLSKTLTINGAGGVLLE